MASSVVSGTLRVTNSSNVITRTFSAFYTASQWNQQDLILANGVSDFIVSIATMSNCGFLALMATSVVRVNFGNHASADSAASLGQNFKDLYARIGSGISGDINLHFANSSGDSATITIVQAI